MGQSNLFKHLMQFNDRSRSRATEGKDKKKILIKVHVFFTKVEN